MIVEGKGRVAPQKVPIVLMEHDRRVCFEAAKDFAAKYSGANSQWKAGLCGGLDLPSIGSLNSEERPFYVGICGELAVQRFVSRFDHTCVVDLEQRRKGDCGVDLRSCGMTMQVKTRQKIVTDTLFHRGESQSNPRPIEAHICVCCEWSKESPTVFISGWAWTADVTALSLEQSHVGSWWNSVVPDSLLNPMSSLGDELEAWRLARKCH